MIRQTFIIYFALLSFAAPFVFEASDDVNYLHEIQSNQVVSNKNPPSRRDFKCSLTLKLKKEIESYRPIVEEIVGAATNGKFKGKVYEELAYFVDKFGPRLSGTKNLEHALDYLIRLLYRYNLENVHGEPVLVPLWKRGNETAVMKSPRHYKFGILGLGGSIRTPPGGITAEVLVVRSFDELHEKADQAKGKIVVFNQNWISYPASVKYRTSGAVEAAKAGAVAVLIRSITPKSLYTLHTGQQDYVDEVRKIPTASITVEDAEFFQRISDRGEKIVVKILMEAESNPMQLSKNVVAEVTGKTKRKEIVLVSGHVDSWDVGQGALDDGVGAFVSWYSLVILKGLGLRPKRTVRVVLWTAEEPGLVGVKQYVKDHSEELDNYNLVMESDEGAFTPEGIEFSGSSNAACILKEIAKLMTPLNATAFKIEPWVGSDISEFIKLGVPAADLINKNDKYFWYHHTDADTMTALNSDDLDKNAAMFAAISYVAADLSVKLPRLSIPNTPKIQSPGLNNQQPSLNIHQESLEDEEKMFLKLEKNLQQLEKLMDEGQR